MRRIYFILLLLGLALAAAPVTAQEPDYQLDRHTVAGGSGQSSGRGYALGGTAGQAEARPAALSGSDYSLWPGFWQAIFGSGGAVRLYLPVIVKNHVSAPDLVITRLNAAGGLTVTVKNQGDAPVTDAFWLDVYFNPSQPPALNQPWPSIAPAGAVWGVTTAIPAGGSLSLTVGDDWYFPQYSSSSFPTGAAVYGYVDSVDNDTGFGGVRESDEGNNRFGPVTSSSGGSPALVNSQNDDPVADDLPQR